MNIKEQKEYLLKYIFSRNISIRLKLELAKNVELMNNELIAEMYSYIKGLVKKC